MKTDFLDKLGLPSSTVRGLRTNLNDKTWNITIDNDEPMFTCPDCGCRMIARWYTLAVGQRGYRYCPYCGKDMKESGQMTVEEYYAKEAINGN